MAYIINSEKKYISVNNIQMTETKPLPTPTVVKAEYPSLKTLVSQDTTNVALQNLISKFSKFFSDGENINSLKHCLKAWKTISVAIEDKDIEINDIVCQSLEEYNLLHEYRNKYQLYHKELNEKVLKKLFH